MEYKVTKFRDPVSGASYIWEGYWLRVTDDDQDMLPAKRESKGKENRSRKLVKKKRKP